MKNDTQKCYFFQRIKREEESGKVKDDSDEDEIEEELEGASSSLNLAELDKLPHLTQASNKSTKVKDVSKKSISFEIPLHDNPEDSGHIVKEKTFVKETPVKQGQPSDEDMFVLSFSTSSSRLS